MTPEEADDRIIKSRQMLHQYTAMIDGGTIPHVDTLNLWSQEIDVLLDIATALPSKASKVLALMKQWRDLMGTIRTVH